jgi:putative CocE/NonD family hydrolase
MKDVYVLMRDGVALAVDLYFPVDVTTHATILAMTPYRKDLAAGDDPESIPASFAPLVEAGFVVAFADARGTGYSEGVYDYYNLIGGPTDGYDLVEWLAAQPWCTGRVGMFGASACAVYCYVTALTAPPHLVAIAALMLPGDFYFDQWRVGGVFRWANRLDWAMMMRGSIEHIDPGESSGAGYERKLAISEQRYRRAGERMVAGESLVDLDWLTDMYHRAEYDAFWEERSLVARASALTVPALHAGVWYDHFIRGTLTMHAAVATPKRLFVAPGQLAPETEQGDGGLSGLVVAWFERFVQGVDNGVEHGPAARVYLMGAERYIDLAEWPVRTTPTELFLREGSAGGRLAVDPPGSGEIADVISHDPEAPNRTPVDVFDQRDFEAGCLTFTSEPLSDDLTVIGDSRLVLYATTDAPDVDWCVRLCDVDESGRSKLLNTGALKGSHLESHRDPTPLEVGRVYRFEIEIWATANLFRAGHRVRVDISNSDHPFFEVNPYRSRNELLHDPEHPSRLVLPVHR